MAPWTIPVATTQFALSQYWQEMPPGNMNRILGDLLCESATERFSPWFARVGDRAVFTSDTIAIKSGGFATFLITVQTKNRGESDSAATTAVTFAVITGTGQIKASATGLKELVRYKYQVASDPPSNGEWVFFRMLEPIWLRD